MVATDTPAIHIGPTTAEKLRGLPWSIATNVVNTFFVQFTFFGSIFVLFLNQLGLNKTQIGLLLSPIYFAGILAIFVAPYAARIGYKRTFVIFFGARKLGALLLLFTPWVLTTYGHQSTVLYVAGTVTVFAILRAVEETAYYPWFQEFCPDAVRGKYSAISSVGTAFTGFIAVSIASYVIDRSTDLSGFMSLFAAGLIFGLVAAWMSSFIPGGAPVAKADTLGSQWQSLREALLDANLIRYLSGAGLFVLATLPLASFLPLYLQERVGLNSSYVVLVQNGTLIGSVMSGYLWGWASDRYGSKPVMQLGIGISVLLPLLWWLTPRESGLSLTVALSVAFLRGVADMGWAIGAGRLLFVSVVPPEKKSGYLALHFAWIGIVAGGSQLAGGLLLDGTEWLTTNVLRSPVDSYLPLLILSTLLSFASLLLLNKMRADNTVGMGEFAGIFLRGNPFRAVSSLVRYNYFTRTEPEAVAATERLGQTQSALTVDELLECLVDPRFHVRSEAIVSIARMRPHPRLTDALVRLLNGNEVALSVAAAWALGRIRDPRALEPLRHALDSPYRSIRTHAIRALGAMGDAESVPHLLASLPLETDLGLCMAYASALGNLGVTEAIPQILKLLETMENEGARTELALDLARIVGNEAEFVQLVRQTRADAGTTLCNVMSALHKGLAHTPQKGNRASLPNEASATANLVELLTRCADQWAADQQKAAIYSTRQIAQLLAPSCRTQPVSEVLTTCIEQLATPGDDKMVYVLLIAHLLKRRARL